ncbi:MAG: bifunctional phosphoribosylaminoimidazolecarboxamide formyltransferase/IMP cyclohydrolase PurH [Planctomycetota bacterium]|nr:MAG: bifunctional phosphoribosylaminoimidazolecarboxamide formyltransferase/IMP cyclohydrolase PurH [Planctomycetota bacterium]
MNRVQRAIISVSDKTGIVELAKSLSDAGIEILSTGGTSKVLKENNIPVIEVSEFTGFPEIMDGRVKTLQPKIHGGILAVRENEEHVNQMATHQIEPIDLLIINLYPFEETINKPDVTFEEAIENIDIGGPAMLRSAGKNHKYVGVIVNPKHYERLINELKENDNTLSQDFKRELAIEVFETTSKYDGMIADYLKKQSGCTELRDQISLGLEKVISCRYGENPHQEGALYELKQATEPGIAAAKQLHGKELSYNNILDVSAAFSMARDFEEPTVVIIKHGNPCGLSSDDNIETALLNAWSGDPMSAYGSVIGINRVITKSLAEKIGNKTFLAEQVIPKFKEETGDDVIVLAAFVEAIIAPGYEPEALEILQKKKNLRIMEQPLFNPKGIEDSLQFRSVPGGILVQKADFGKITENDLSVPTKEQPTDEQLQSLLFAEKVAKHVKSNAIVLVKGKTLVGAGAGQMSRFDSCKIAAEKAGKRAVGAVLASDAMFPSRDGLDAAVETGAVAIIQPGGSIRDDDVVEAANEHKVPMLFTGMRHFLH